MGVCYLIGAGDFYGQITRRDDDFIIAADGGYDSLIRHGYTPDLLIGDFDSLKSDIPEGVRTIRHPKEKDETDMFLAYGEGVKLGYTEFVMLGATGGRLDHTYANISLLQYGKERGHNITVIDENGIILCLKNESITLSGNSGDTFSVFAIGGEARGVSIKGAKYEAENVTLSPAFPLGVSNEFTDTDAHISIIDGALLVIAK
jgi:thiamine pyrophosphokinase